MVGKGEDIKWHTIIVDLAIAIDVCLADHLVDLGIRKFLS